MKFTCVCSHCNYHTKEEDGATIEFNFRDLTIYFLCMNCKKMNKILLKPPDRPLPKTRVGNW